MARRFTFQGHASVTSTNDLVKQAIEQDVPEGLVVFAREQTAGYGRQGRVWSSPLGGSYESFLLRPDVVPQQVPTIALVAGLAVRRALCGIVGCAGADEGDAASEASPAANAKVAASSANAECAAGVASAAGASAPMAAGAGRLDGFAGAQSTVPSAADDAPLVQLKWPNDVVCAAGKLAGISSEVHAGAVCIGIGVNVFVPEHPRDVGGKNVPAYLVDLIGDDRMPRYACETRGLTASQAACIERVARAVADAFETCYDQWLEQGLAPFADELRRVSSLDGKRVRVATRTGEALAEGMVAGIDDHGRLLVETADGVVAVSSGEAHLL